MTIGIGHHDHRYRAGTLAEQEHQMPRRDDPKSNRTAKSGDDFQNIAGIGPVLAQRLWNAGILTYDDLARRTPAEIATMLADVAGISAERIASQNWVADAHARIGP
jgi:predicted flap endonuclease-1-like 5' DNA nuclease